MPAAAKEAKDAVEALAANKTSFRDLVLRAMKELPTDRKGLTRQAIVKHVLAQDDCADLPEARLKNYINQALKRFVFLEEFKEVSLGRYKINKEKMEKKKVKKPAAKKVGPLTTEEKKEAAAKKAIEKKKKVAEKKGKEAKEGKEVKEGKKGKEEKGCRQIGPCQKGWQNCDHSSEVGCQHGVFRRG